MAFAQRPLYSCKLCPFIASEQWYCDLHRKLNHDKLRADKVQMLITTLLNTIVHPHATDNITIEINLKNNYLKNELVHEQQTATTTQPAERETVVSHDHLAEPIKRKASVPPATSKKKKTTKAHIAEVMRTSETQRLGNIETCYFTEANKAKTINLASDHNLNLIVPNEDEIVQFRFISMWERLSWNLSDKNSKDNLPQSRLDRALATMIKSKHDNNEIVCRNKCREFVANSEIKFKWSPEWWLKFATRYELTNMTNNMGMEDNFTVLRKCIRNYDLVQKLSFPNKGKRLCRWKCEKFSSDGKRIKESTVSVNGCRRGDQNCPSYVSRPCSNRLCEKAACTQFHSFGLCEICAEQMPLICENIEYGRFVSAKRGKCQGTYSKCLNETKVQCANASCRRIICRQHTRHLCLDCILLPTRAHYQSASHSQLTSSSTGFSAVVHDFTGVTCI